ncbi:hypothetical protein B0H16DRAFT_1336531, partial [Mycena metata]
EWNPWPDSEFERDFTWAEFENTKQLQVHWSCRVTGGDRKGKDMADNWEGGKRSTRTCQGIITCDQARFEEIVTAHPKTRALGLVVGVPGIRGPGESVADISPVYLNADRVRKERDKIKQGDGQGGDGFIAEFAAFAETYTNFVVYSQLGAVTVICMQTPFMASQLLKAELITTGPVNGLVSDAAHGWWLIRTSLLIITSVYCVELCCWVPAIFSYSNDATAAHYECHFYALLESIAHQAELRKVEVTDELFAGVKSILAAAFVKALM